MSPAEHAFATVLGCIDGRVQDPLARWVRERYGVDYVDTVTEPGPDAVLAEADDDRLRQIAEKVAVSQRAHGSRLLVVAGHAGCAGNPVDDEAHAAMLRSGAERLAAHLPEMAVVPVYVREDAHGWSPEPAV